MAATKVATKVKAKKAGASTNLVVTTVPPTREVPGRVFTGKTLTGKETKCTYFLDDRKKSIRKEWHASVKDNKLTIVEGDVGCELTQTVEEFRSKDAALAAMREKGLALYRHHYEQFFMKKDGIDFFLAPPPKAPKAKANAKSAANVDATPAPDAKDLIGYASDGRMVKDIQALLHGAKATKKLPARDIADLKKNVGPLPKETQKALLGIADAAAAGKMKSLAWDLTIGYRLVSEHDDASLKEHFGGNKKWVELGKTSVEIFHDGGLSHYTACVDGLRVYNNEGSFEPVFCKSVDAFMWALVHRTAAGQGTYDAATYAKSLKKLGISRELPLR